MSKTSHILCIAAGHGEGQYAPKLGFNTFAGRLSEIVTGDLWIGHRPVLEKLTPLRSSLLGGRRIMDVIFAAVPKDGVETKGLFSEITDILGGFVNHDEIDYPAHIQIIPYYLFRYRGEFLSYERPVTGGDDRLHGKISIGIGGHIDLVDVKVAQDGSIDLEATLEAGGKREGVEELGIEIDETKVRLVGTIYAKDTEVDRVHLGVVGIYDLSDDEHAKLNVNHEIGLHSFTTMGALKALVDGDETKTLETWSRLIIETNPLA